MHRSILCILLAFWCSLASAGRWAAPYEAIYAFLAYQAEVEASEGRPSNIAPTCRGSGPRGSCDLNEFLRHVSHDPKPPQVRLSSDHKILSVDDAADTLRWGKKVPASQHWKVEPSLLAPFKFGNSGSDPVKHSELNGHLRDILDDSQRVLGPGPLDKHMRNVVSTLDRAMDARRLEISETSGKVYDKILRQELKWTYEPKTIPANGPFPEYEELDFRHIRAQLSDDQQRKFDTMIRDMELRRGGKKINVNLASHFNNIDDLNIFKQQAEHGPCDG